MAGTTSGLPPVGWVVGEGGHQNLARGLHGDNCLTEAAAVSGGRQPHGLLRGRELAPLSPYPWGLLQAPALSKPLWTLKGKGALDTLGWPASRAWSRAGVDVKAESRHSAQSSLQPPTPWDRGTHQEERG